MRRSVLLLAGLLLCATSAGAQNLYKSSATIQDVKNAAAAGMDLEAKNAEGLTPLFCAVRGNPNIEVIKALIAAGAAVNAVDSSGYSVLVYAADFHDNPEVIRVLLKAGAEIDHVDKKGMTPIMWAAGNNHNPVVTQALIDGGADRTLKSKEGKSAYDYGVGNPNLKGTATLVALGARRTNDEKAREAYTEALALAADGKQDAAIAKLDAAVNYLGSTNVKIQPPLIRSLVAQKDYPRAQAELKTYFSLSVDTTLAEYAAMKELSASTDKILQQDEAGFQAAKRMNEWQTFLVYLDTYPFGLHRNEATRLAAALDDAAFANAVKAGTIDSYESYLGTFGRGAHGGDAWDHLATLRDDDAFATAARANNKTAYEAYQKYYPRGRHIPQAQSAWNAIDAAEKSAAQAKAQAQREAQRQELTAELSSERSQAAGHYTIGTLKVIGGVGLGAFALWCLLSDPGSSSSSDSSDSTLTILGAGALLPAGLLIVFCGDDFSAGDHDSEQADETASELARLSVTLRPAPGRAWGGMLLPGIGLSARIPLWK